MAAATELLKQIKRTNKKLNFLAPQDAVRIIDGLRHDFEVLVVSGEIMRAESIYHF